MNYDFMYYFQTEVAGFSQFTFALIGVVGSCCLFVAVFLYRLFFSRHETRSLILMALIIEVAAGVFSLLFVLRVNLLLGIPDIWFVFLTSTTTSAFIEAFTMLPPLVLFAKLVPKKVEATVFAFATTIAQGVSRFGGKATGLLVNRFVGVTRDNLDRFWILLVIQIAMNFIPMTFLCLIPTQEEVAEVQTAMKESREFDEVDVTEDSLTKATDKQG